MTQAMTLTDILWEQLEASPWADPESLAESMIWLLYARWLEQQGQAYSRQDCDKRMSFWRELSPRVRFRHLQQIVYPCLQARAAMSGQLIGLILSTVPFSLPEAPALSRLLSLIELHEPADLLEALLPLLQIQEPGQAALDEIFALLALRADSVIWDPACRSGRFLAHCARSLQQRHWRTIWADPGRLSRWRSQFGGRVHSRCEALLSAIYLLLAHQASPGLDGYSLPWPAPDLIWVADRARLDLSETELLGLLAPGGRLAIWHPGKARQGRLPLSQGSLELREAPPVWQVREPAAIYRPAAGPERLPGVS